MSTTRLSGWHALLNSTQICITVYMTEDSGPHYKLQTVFCSAPSLVDAQITKQAGCPAPVPHKPQPDNFMHQVGNDVVLRQIPSSLWVCVFDQKMTEYDEVALDFGLQQVASSAVALAPGHISESAPCTTL